MPLRPGRAFKSLYQRRLYTTNPPPSSSRIARLEARLPRFLRHYTSPLRTAPFSHITAFLILHELTAIIPLFGLAALFHYSGWLPKEWSEGNLVQEGRVRFGRYLRKKGWIGEEGEESGNGKWIGDEGVKIVVELATAYAITKALLPIRLGLSVWATPWFARWTVLPVTRLMRRVAGVKGVRPTASPAAGTGAVAGGALPKDVGVK